MSSRNVALRRDIYEALEKEKRPGESFTGVLERLLAQRSPLEDLVGAWGSAPTGPDLRRLRGLRGDPAPRRR